MSKRSLTWEQAAEIRAKYDAGLATVSELAAQHETYDQIIWHILVGNTYRNPNDLRVSEARPERAIPPIPSHMSGAMPPQLPNEDVHAYIIRHNEPVAAYYARLDARSDALDPAGPDRYAASLAAARARWQSMGLDGAVLDGAREAA